MNAYLWSIVERFGARLFSALLTLVLPLFAAPAMFGAYSYMVALYLILQAITDTAWRETRLSLGQIGQAMQKRLLLAIRVGALLSSLGLCVGLIFMPSLGYAVEDSKNLWPFLLAPFATSFFTLSIAGLQSAGMFSLVAKMQILASLGGLVFALPFLLVNPILAAALQTLLAEIFMAAMSSRTYSAYHSSIGVEAEPVSKERTIEVMRTCFGISLVYAITLGGAYLDRLFLGLLAGAATTGVFAFSYSVSRLLPEAIVFGTLNVFRVRVAGVKSAADVALIATDFIHLSAFTQFGIVAPLVSILPIIIDKGFNPAWGAAAITSQVLCLGIFPVVLSVTCRAILVTRGRAYAGTGFQVFSLCLAPAVGFAGSIYVPAAGALFVVRDTLVAGRRWRLLEKELRPPVGPLLMALGFTCAIIFETSQLTPIPGVVLAFATTTIGLWVLGRQSSSATLLLAKGRRVMQRRFATEGGT